MKRAALLAIAIVSLTLTQANASSPQVFAASRHDTSRPLRNMITSVPEQGQSNQKQEPRPTRALISTTTADPVTHQLTGSLPGVTTGLNFEGQSAIDNRNVFGFAFVPPDTNGAVGDTQYVQMVNVTIAVYDKKTGATILGPAAIHSVWAGFGGPCETEYPDGGDPVVLYDHLAGRWLVSQLQYNGNFTQNEQCVAISTSSDATGSYNRYEFDYGANFPDYPKFGIWPDAYYNTVNMFIGNGFGGAQACAFDRNAMLAGSQASGICFPPDPNVGSLLPSDLDGTAPAVTGEPNFFLHIADATHLNLYKFHADFANPSNSTFTGPTAVTVAPFSEICARATTVACIPEPNPGEKVDGLSDRLMFRLAYRNFGDHESLFVNHTVAGGALGGVRWYEIRNPQTSPAVYQQGTVVDPNVDYWLGSIASDKAGNIALGFSASGRAVNPSIYVSGRAPSDPLGILGGPLVLAGGTGVQVQSYKRWGDYSAMTVDPTDDCTFWYTNEYYQTTAPFNWTTRIGSFKFDSCRRGK
jgi:hypothetical protein